MSVGDRSCKRRPVLHIVVRNLQVLVPGNLRSTHSLITFSDCKTCTEVRTLQVPGPTTKAVYRCMVHHCFVTCCLQRNE